MSNYATQFLNRIVTKKSKPELDAIKIPIEVEILRIGICNSCTHLDNTTAQCNQNNCFITLMIESPVLRCPLNKWEPFLT